MKRIILVDGNSIMYRAYYGTAYTGNLMQTKNGLFTNAIYAFVNMVNTITNDSYDNILFAFDAGKQTFRHEKMEDYKGGRSPMPDEFRVQIPYIKEFLDICNISRYEMPLYEADDIIGTMANIAKNNGYHVDIYSSDKDLLQLIDDNVTVHLTKKGITELESYTPGYFLEKYQIPHTAMCDLKGLMGDASDNLKGISGVGEKTAIKLLQEYKCIENIIENKDNIKGKLGEKIKEEYPNALMCKEIATININSPIAISLDDTNSKERDYDKLQNFYKDLEFHSFLKKIVKKEKFDFEYKMEFNLDDVLVNNSAIYMEMLEENYHSGNIVGFGISNANGNFYLDKAYLKNEQFIKYLEDDNLIKYTFDYKKIYASLKYQGINLKGVCFDLLLGAYLINQKLVKDGFKPICSYFSYENVLYDEEVYGKGAKLALPEEKIYSAHIAKKAKAIYSLYDEVISNLKKQNQLKLFNDIEIPLSRCLADMEIEGLKVDLEELKSQKKILAEKIILIEDDIFDSVGFEFNLSSPKQLGEVLFEKLGLPHGKKTKTGYSTSQEVLEELAIDYPLCYKILEYRQLTKLYSTYIEGINQVLFDDGKVHTIYKQALTETGRLSSIEPNLQNIPIRTPEGSQIRKMFIPSKDYLVGMDYSQIELRVLASMANVKGLKEAFVNKRDVHTETAKMIFHKDEVTKEERRAAKAVNFGIIYGISPWGLAKDINVTQKEAKEFIDNYYQNYPEIKIYMDDTIEFLKENGYVKTIMGRRRYIPEINSNVYMQREFAKRMAMNAPIQGSAADIIKKAMVMIYNKLNELNLKSKLILQVHDELIIDCDKNELDIVLKILKEEMENVIDLSLPLEVDGGYGETWLDAK